MIVSFGRTNDERKLLDVYEAMERSLKLWTTADIFEKDAYYRHFRLFSADARTLKNRIDTHDYSEQDKRDAYFLSIVGKTQKT